MANHKKALLDAREQLEIVADADLSREDESLVLLRNAAVRALGRNGDACALASETHAEVITAVSEPEGSDPDELVTVQLVGSRVPRVGVWQTMSVILEAEGSIHTFDYQVFGSTVMAGAYSIGASPERSSYRRIHAATRDGTYTARREHPHYEIGDAKAHTLAIRAAGVLMRGTVNAEYTDAYGEEAAIDTRAWDVDAMHRVSMADPNAAD